MVPMRSESKSGGAPRRRGVWWLTGVMALAAGASGCAAEDARQDIVATPDPLLPKQDADDLFNGKLPTFELELLDTSWDKFRADGQAEQYAPAALKFNGKYVGEIAVRVKGQYSVHLCYPDGELVCDKLSLRLKFDAADEELRFFGLKRLSLHALEHDVSHLRERLAYDLFRAMDVPASRSSWAQLVVDGEPQGLYSMVEEVDGVFTDDRFPQHGDGDLYKEVWPTSTNAGYYEEGLETNEETADASNVVAFARALTAPESAEERLEVLGKYMDRDALSRYMAVDDAVADWDGITTFYYDHDGHNHNFFLYADEPGEEPPFTLIPWDMDNTFMAANWRTRAPGWREKAKDCELTNGVYPPSCDPLLSALLLDQERYTEAANTLLDGPFSEAEMDAQIDQHVKFIEKAVAADPFGPTVEAWERDVAEVRRNLGLLREQLKTFAKGETVQRVGVEPTRLNDYTDVTPLQVELGISVYAAEGVKSSVKVVGEGELTGLRFSFDMPDVEGGPWVSFAMPFPNGDADLRELTGIRFRAKGKSLPSYVRVRVESSASTDSSVAWNWPLELEGSVETYELLFAELGWADGGDPPNPVGTWLARANGISIVLAGEPGAGELEIDDIEMF
jgi:spore coat protein H